MNSVRQENARLKLQASKMDPRPTETLAPAQDSCWGYGKGNTLGVSFGTRSAMESAVVHTVVVIIISALNQGSEHLVWMTRAWLAKHCEDMV